MSDAYGTPKILLKFRADMPINLRTALVDFGFEIYSAKHGEWVMYSKPDNSSVEYVLSDERDWVTELEDRFTRLVDAYLDPYAHLDKIEHQVRKIAEGLPEEQQEWCLNWIKDILYDDCPPWESDPEDFVDQQQFGFC